MGELANRIATRLLIEQSYALLTDRDDYPVLPEEKRFVALYDKANTDGARQQVLDEWLTAERAFLKAQPVVGGPLYSLLFLVIMATISVAATGTFRWGELIDLALYTAYCFVGIQFSMIPIILFTPANRSAVP